LGFTPISISFVRPLKRALPIRPFTSAPLETLGTQGRVRGITGSKNQVTAVSNKQRAHTQPNQRFILEYLPDLIATDLQFFRAWQIFL
jgi:hypothetical protein